MRSLKFPYEQMFQIIWHYESICGLKEVFARKIEVRYINAIFSKGKLLKENSLSSKFLCFIIHYLILFFIAVNVLSIFLSPALYSDTGFHMLRLFWETLTLLGLYTTLIIINSQSWDLSVVVRQAVESECWVFWSFTTC